MQIALSLQISSLVRLAGGGGGGGGRGSSRWQIVSLQDLALGSGVRLSLQCHSCPQRETQSAAERSVIAMAFTAARGEGGDGRSTHGHDVLSS